jgi:hypothetical protein
LVLNTSALIQHAPALGRRDATLPRAEGTLIREKRAILCGSAQLL